MSKAIESACWELDLDKSAKMVLCAIADHANDDGYCWPSIARIAWKCGYSQPRTVGAIIRRLVDDGILAIIEPPRGRRSALYQVRPHKGKKLPPFDPAMFDPSGAEIAPQENGADENVPETSGLQTASDAHPAKNAPLRRSPAKVAGRRSVGVQSSTRRGAKNDIVGVQKTAPESSGTVRNPRARDGPGRSPPVGAAGAERDARLDNSARNLGIPPQGTTESLEAFRRRIDEAHGARLRARLEQLGGEERAPARPAREPPDPPPAGREDAA